MIEKSLSETKRMHLKNRIDIIKENIKRAAEESGRNFKDIVLVAATKTVPSNIINEAITCGISNIGENRVQEFLKKEEGIDNDKIRTHFIGHLQRNKVKSIIRKVDLIQSVDTFKLAKEISDRSLEENLTMEILLEVNIGREENKYGFAKEDLKAELDKICKLPNIKVKGLMAVVPMCKDRNLLKEFFNEMNALFVDIRNEKHDNIDMEYLSMGMSSDYMEAIRCGSNMVRIGSAIFGERN